ncbi:MAG: alpha-L-rhamnosidase N-terminal domain-containing protein, partial [Victivallales bacterium]|nr:alpha-L-rhamnosidase N-terminal domain-containing protein [Victivallales bacterium]
MHEFEGKWITTAELAALPTYNVYHRQLDKSAAPNPYSSVNNRHVLSRKKFNLDAVEPGRIYITADDYYKLYINGHFVGQGPAPCHPIRQYYNELDITPFLLAGENTIAVH